MRIERFRVDAFGRLADFDSGADPMPGLVVVLGPNEAGKSTVFEFLTTQLYGFQPASRDLNPLVPWGADEAGGSMQLRLADGRCAEVRRRLRSSPAARLELDGHGTELRNQPVPWVEHVPRRVFRQVFAVTLAELASLDDETWARIQDRVVGSMGASDLRPARAVADALEKEAGELWRPSRRGNQKVRDARERVRDIRARRREALERDRRTRGLVRELESTRRSLAAKRERRERDRIAVDRIQLLAPVRARLRRIEALRGDGGPEELLRDLPASPVERLEELQAAEARLSDRLRALDAERDEPSRALAARDAGVEAILQGRDEITRFASAVARVAADRERILELRAEVEALGEALDRTSETLVGRPWKDAPPAALLSLSPAAVRDAVHRLERARRSQVALEARGATGDSHAPGAAAVGGPWAGIGILVVGLALLAWAAAGEGGTASSAVGAALSTAGAAVLWLALRARRERARRASARQRERDAAEAEVQAARQAFRAMTRDLRLPAAYLDEPGPEFAAGVERIQDLALRQRARARALDEATDRVEAAAREGRSLAARVSVACGPGDDAVELAALLSDRLRRAERVEQAAASARRELERLDRARADLEDELEAVRTRLSVLMGTGTRFAGGGTPAEGLAIAAARMRAHEHARRLEEELESSHPDLPVLRARIEEAERAGESWLMDDGDLAARKARMEALTGEIEDLLRRAEALEAEIEHARRLETPDAVDGELASLQEEIAARVRERDRKWVLARLLRQADRSFREAHQPDLVRRASAYLAHLTSGRYDRLLVEETAVGELFRIAGPGLPGPVPLRHPVSTGTLEQAYLSLRLAIVDHLDHGVETLPLFIDEVFVNWDDHRRARGLETMARISRDRQVFVFTCHPSVADELVAAGARLVRLDTR